MMDGELLAAAERLTLFSDPGTDKLSGAKDFFEQVSQAKLAFLAGITLARAIPALLAERDRLRAACEKMVKAQDAPTNGDDGGNEERAQAWLSLRAALTPP